jgi:four helix bundle protein
MPFEDLDVWKRSARLSAEIYKELAEKRDFGIKDQITRARLSLPSNIAGSMDRFTLKEKTYFLHIAKCSCSELRNQTNQRHDNRPNPLPGQVGSIYPMFSLPTANCQLQTYL